MHHDSAAGAIGNAVVGGTTTAAATMGFFEWWGFVVGAITFAVSIYMTIDTIMFRKEQRKLMQAQRDKLAKDEAEREARQRQITVATDDSRVPQYEAI